MSIILGYIDRGKEVKARNPGFQGRREDIKI